MTTFAGGTAQNTVIATRLVTFVDGYNNSTISEQTIEVGTDAEVPNDPSHQNLVFAGWYRYDDQDERVTDFTNILENLRVVAKYASDLNGNGIADEDETRYTITFRDSFDGSILGTEQVLPGMSATAPIVPAHEGRTFVGWNGAYTNVTRSATVDTVYTVDAVENPEQPGNVLVEETFYTVTFIDDDTDEVISTVRVREGLTAPTPNIPTHENRVFDRYVGDYSNVTSDRTIRVLFTDDLNGDGTRDDIQTHYTVEFMVLPYLNGIHGKFEDGAILKYENIVEGVKFSQVNIVVPKAVPENEHYSVSWKQDNGDTITDWDNTEDVTVNSNLIYTVSFIPDVDKNNDGITDTEQQDLLRTLKITYVNKNGKELAIAYEHQYLVGEEYKVSSPDVAKYTANIKVVEGKMQADENGSVERPYEITVQYTAKTENDTANNNGIADDDETYQLTVKHISKSAEGKEITLHEPTTQKVVAFTTYTAEPVELEFYEPKAVVTGEMPNQNHEVVIEYKTKTEDSNHDGIADETQSFEVKVRVPHGKVKEVSEIVKYGTRKVFVVEPEEGYTIDGMTVDCTGVTIEGNKVIVVVKKETTCTVSLPQKKYTVEVTAENGNIKNENGSFDTTSRLEVVHGNNAVFDLEANPKYVFDNIDVTCASATVDAENKILTIANITSNVSCKVTYKLDNDGNGIADDNQFNLTVEINHGTTEQSKFSVKKGEIIKFKVTPNTGYKLTDYTNHGINNGVCPVGVFQVENDQFVLDTSKYNRDLDCGINLNPDMYRLDLYVESDGEITYNYRSGGTINTITNLPKPVVENRTYSYTSCIYNKTQQELPQSSISLNGEMISVKNIAEDTTCTAHFILDQNGDGIDDRTPEGQVTLTFAVGNHGTLVGNTTITGAYNQLTLEEIASIYGDVIPTVNPENGYHFDGWDNKNITISGNTTFTASIVGLPQELVVNYVSIGEKENHPLTKEPVKTTVLTGERYDVTSDFPGYTLITEPAQQLTGNMPVGGLHLTVKYEPVNDRNHNGQNDDEETIRKTVTVRHISINPTDNEENELLIEPIEDLLVGEERTINASEVLLSKNYELVSTESSKTITVSENDSENIVTFIYRVKEGSDNNHNGIDDNDYDHEIYYTLNVRYYRIDPISNEKIELTDYAVVDKKVLSNMNYNETKTLEFYKADKTVEGTMDSDKTIVVTYIYQKPTVVFVTPVADRTTWTNENVIVEVEATAVTENVQYSFNGGAWTTSNQFVVSASAETVSVVVKDENGVSSETIERVVYVDKDKPVVNVTAPDGKKELTSVEVQVQVNDLGNSKLSEVNVVFGVTNLTEYNEAIKEMKEHGETALSLLNSDGTVSNFSAYQEGKYFVYAKDHAGNEGFDIVEVKNLKKEGIQEGDPDGKEDLGNGIKAQYSIRHAGFLDGSLFGILPWREITIKSDTENIESVQYVRGYYLENDFPTNASDAEVIKANKEYKFTVQNWRKSATRVWTARIAYTEDGKTKYKILHIYN